jgi:uncharacterized protein (DUF1015 family)
MSEFVAPPYDEMSAGERRKFADRDPHNIVHLILPEGNGDKYELAGKTVRDWRLDGTLRTDEEEGMYVVTQEFRAAGGHLFARTGVIGAIAVEPYSRGRVKPHVKTHSGPKAGRLALLAATDSMFEALLLLTRDEGGELSHSLSEVTAGEPSFRVELEDVYIRVWHVTREQAWDLAHIAGAGCLYLADGHHRYETALAYLERNPAAGRTLGLIVPIGDPGLMILPTHRLVYGEGVDVDAMIAEVQEKFQVHELARGVSFVEHLEGLQDRGTACVVVRGDGSAVSLLLKPGANLGDLPFANEPTVASLDVSRVDELIVRRLLATAGKSGRLEYSANPDRVLDEVCGGTAGAAVMLNPTSVEQVLAVADAGAVMPQKATYFVPKVPSGLVTLAWAAREDTERR